MSNKVCSSVGGIDDALGTLHGNLSRIADSLNQLEAKLLPVLIPETTSALNEGVSEIPSYSPMHCDIDGVNTGLREINRRVVSMLEQTDLTRDAAVAQPKQL